MTATLTIAGKVTATLVDQGPDGMVYRLRDARGYTHRTDTIRVSPGRENGREEGYTVTTLRREGWTFLLSGRGHDDDIDYRAAVTRVVAVLYGVEDHG